MLSVMVYYCQTSVRTIAPGGRHIENHSNAITYIVSATQIQEVVAGEFNLYFISLGRNTAEETKHVAQVDNIDLNGPLFTAFLI